MKLFRFMSKKEFYKYINGEILENKTNHNKEYNRRTNSTGFCFLDYKKYKPEEAFHFLSGIVDIDVCAVFDVDKKYVNISYGIYANQEADINLFDILMGVMPTFKAKEYCTTKYSNKEFKLLEYAIPEWSNKEQWNWKK